MKNHRSFRYILLVLTLFLAGSMVSAQNKKDEEAENKAAIEAERKAVQEEQMKVRKEMLERQQQEMKEQQMEMRELENQYREQAIEFEHRARESERARERESFRVIEPDSRVYRIPDGNFLLGSYGHENQSQLTLRNSFNGGSDSSSGEFDVNEEVRYFRCQISGKVKSGEIAIQINYPSGKVFKDLTINSSAEISFSQSMTIKEGEEDKYLGTWDYSVKAKEAEGNYMLQIMTE